MLASDRYVAASPAATTVILVGKMVRLLIQALMAKWVIRMSMLTKDRFNNMSRLATVVIFAMVSAISCAQQEGTSGTAASATYPDWSGQWQRIGSLNWPPEGYAEAGACALDRGIPGNLRREPGAAQQWRSGR